MRRHRIASQLLCSPMFFALKCEIINGKEKEREREREREKWRSMFYLHALRTRVYVCECVYMCVCKCTKSCHAHLHRSSERIDEMEMKGRSTCLTKLIIVNSSRNERRRETQSNANLLRQESNISNTTTTEILWYYMRNLSGLSFLYTHIYYILNYIFQCVFLIYLVDISEKKVHLFHMYVHIYK